MVGVAAEERTAAVTAAAEMVAVEKELRSPP